MTLSHWRRALAWLLAWALVAAVGAGWLVHARLLALEDAFVTDARIVHRLLSQRAVQHDAVMAMLPLLQPPAEGQGSSIAMPLPRLPAAYPQIAQVLRRLPGSAWPADLPAALGSALDAAEARSRHSGHAELAQADLPRGRAWLALAGLADQAADHALLLDLHATIPWDEWPMDAQTSPVRVRLQYQGHAFGVQAGRRLAHGWHYDFHKLLASQSQPFDVVLERDVGWSELPWGPMLAWAAASATALAALRTLLRQRVAARRAEELLRLGQVARLNQLGELAAGMAHELNQPLTALLASTQAAQRLLDEEEPDLDTARHAMGQAVAQARRASAVVGRLRRVVERPDLSGQAQSLALPAAVHDALHLLEPELRRRGIAVQVDAPADLPAVRAEPVALQQIIHNLVMNALQAMEQSEAGQRRLRLALVQQGSRVLLSVRDTGPGVAPEARARLFTPFYTTRPGGLGLGLSLSESLAQAMGGELSLAPPAAADGAGAEFHLLLPLAHQP
ncbi:ATP-binding protein [Comamonas sp. w2-DMI]|uniref:sensor histidine kinase n=1 Tax=Comamonas sp. w2-DMI TaxID=3126391 RepID=UPI0032E4ACF5